MIVCWRDEALWGLGPSAVCGFWAWCVCGWSFDQSLERYTWPWESHFTFSFSWDGHIYFHLLASIRKYCSSLIWNQILRKKLIYQKCWKTEDSENRSSFHLDRTSVLKKCCVCSFLVFFTVYMSLRFWRLSVWFFFLYFFFLELILNQYFNLLDNVSYSPHLDSFYLFYCPLGSCDLILYIWNPTRYCFKKSIVT